MHCLTFIPVVLGLHFTPCPSELGGWSLLEQLVLLGDRLWVRQIDGEGAGGFFWRSLFSIEISSGGVRAKGNQEMTQSYPLISHMRNGGQRDGIDDQSHQVED